MSKRRIFHCILAIVFAVIMFVVLHYNVLPQLWDAWKAFQRASGIA